MQLTNKQNPMLIPDRLMVENHSLDSGSYLTKSLDRQCRPMVSVMVGLLFVAAFIHGSLAQAAPAATNSFQGAIDMNANKIIDLAQPTSPQDAATKKYVDDNSGGGGSADNLGNHTATTTLNLNSQNLTNANNVYANRFYDRASSAYYIDPASTSRVNTLRSAYLCDENGSNCKDVSSGWSSGGSADNLGNHTATGSLNMSSNRITNLTTPSSNYDAATKKYVDDNSGGGGSYNGDYLPSESYQASTSQTFFTAVDTCANSSYGTHTDWHLPSAFEAEYLDDNSLFGAVNADHWTITPTGEAGGFKGVISYFLVNPSNQSRKSAAVTLSKRVRCAR